MTKQPAQSSLRALARSLRVTHSALSEAVHGGRLTKGVRIDARGRVDVYDAGAAAAQWRDVHIVRVDEMVRREAAERRQAARAAVAVPLFVDPDSGFDWTGPELLAVERSRTLLVHAFVDLELAEAADREAAARALSKRVAARLRALGPKYFADAKTVIADAERSLGFMVAEALTPEGDEP